MQQTNKSFPKFSQAVKDTNYKVNYSYNLAEFTKALTNDTADLRFKNTTIMEISYQGLEVKLVYLDSPKVLITYTDIANLDNTIRATINKVEMFSSEILLEETLYIKAVTLISKKLKQIA